MTNHFWQNLHSFCVAGINYRMSDVNFRSRYSIHEPQGINIYKKLRLAGIKECFILSTCNRTELYFHGGSLLSVLKIWGEEVNGDENELFESVYIHEGVEAVKHLFKVSSGLDSQILGDYEISGQLKKAFTIAKKENATGAFIERLFNTMQYVSKRIRTETKITEGSVSVSHFAVNYIHDHLKHFPKANILLLGMGKIGINTLKGLSQKVPNDQVCIINRTHSKALELSEMFNIKCRQFELLDESVNIADVIIVATNAPQPVVISSQMTDEKKRLIIDLSIPSNVAVEVKANPLNTFLNVDELSKYTDETLKNRFMEIPTALHIIDEGIEIFITWLKERSGYHKVEYIKNHIITFHKSVNDCPVCEQKIIKRCNDFFVQEVKQQQIHGCRHIELMNELISYSLAV